MPVVPQTIVHRLAECFSEQGILPPENSDLSFTKFKVLFDDATALQHLEAESNGGVNVVQKICQLFRNIVKGNGLANSNVTRVDIIEHVAFVLSQLGSFQSTNKFVNCLLALGRRKVLSAAFANLMQSVSQFEKPYGHVEVLRHLLLRARPVQTDFIVESVLPMLENAPASTKQFFQGALGFIRRYLSKKLANFKVPAEILLEGLGEEWRFRIPDVEQEVGALNDIRKSGPLLRHWKRSTEAHFRLAQYQSLAVPYLKDLRDSPSSTCTALVKIVRAALQDSIFERYRHAEYGSESSVCSLCSRSLYEIAPSYGVGPLHEDQVTAVRLKCNCRMHKSCKQRAVPRYDRHGRRLCPNCTQVPEALWEIESETSTSSLPAMHWQQYHYHYLLCSVPTCMGLNGLHGNGCFVHSSDEVMRACSIFAGLKRHFGPRELRLLAETCSNGKQASHEAGASTSSATSDVIMRAARFHNILRISSVFSELSFEGLCQKLALGAEEGRAIALCADMIRLKAISATISYKNRAVAFTASKTQSRLNVSISLMQRQEASQLFQEVTQLCGTIMSNDLVASEAEKQHAQGSVIDNKGENRTLLS